MKGDDTASHTSKSTVVSSAASSSVVSRAPFNEDVDYLVAAHVHEVAIRQLLGLSLLQHYDDSGRCVVERITENCDAYVAGIRTGDIVVAANDPIGVLTTNSSDTLLTSSEYELMHIFTNVCAYIHRRIGTFS